MTPDHQDITGGYRLDGRLLKRRADITSHIFSIGKQRLSGRGLHQANDVFPLLGSVDLDHPLQLGHIVQTFRNSAVEESRRFHRALLVRLLPTLIDDENQGCLPSTALICPRTKRQGQLSDYALETICELKMATIHVSFSALFFIQQNKSACLMSRFAHLPTVSVEVIFMSCR